MLFQNLLLCLPAALLASAAPADVDSLADAGPPPAADSAPGAVNNSVKEVVVATASAASPCSDWVELYGRGRWTYVEVQWCFRQGAKQTVVTQEQRNPWYYWGLAWYTGKSHKLAWQTKGTIGGTRDFDSGKDFNDGPVKKDIYTFKTKIPSGIYAVNLHYYQEGPWWGADAAIDPDVTFSISLGK